MCELIHSGNIVEYDEVLSRRFESMIRTTHLRPCSASDLGRCDLITDIPWPEEEERLSENAYHTIDDLLNLTPESRPKAASRSS